MEKSWADMTSAEKIETLHKELIALGERVNEIASKHDAVEKMHNALATLVHDIDKKINGSKGR